MKCRHCGASLELTFVNLGSAPPSNAYLTEADLAKPEIWYPLHILVCSKCWLVQTEDYTGASEIFREDYAYFSSYSRSWLEHAERYVIDVVERFQLGRDSLVVELAANDGYLLQYVATRKIPCLGIEPTASTANSARAKGIEIIERFFGVKLAHEIVTSSTQADLIVANNVLAHVPDINDFVAGVAILLKENGVATFEFPHLLNLVSNNQFDTIYHEHYSYLSLVAANRIFDKNGLSVFDVEELATHGGSLRVYAQRKHGQQLRREAVNDLLDRELSAGIATATYYSGFQDRTDRAKNGLVKFLLDAKREGKKVGAYGAAAKGNTLMNYAGLRPDLIPYVVDKSPAKQGKFLPGTRIPVVSEEYIRRERPDYIVILPWNLWDEIRSDLVYARDWGGRFVRAIPELHIA
jgi:SAM-dependent methyltransferase